MTFPPISRRSPKENLEVHSEGGREGLIGSGVIGKPDQKNMHFPLRRVKGTNEQLASTFGYAGHDEDEQRHSGSGGW